MDGVVSAKLDASAALAASGALPENVNLRGEKQFSVELPRIRAGSFGQVERARYG